MSQIHFQTTSFSFGNVLMPKFLVYTFTNALLTLSTTSPISQSPERSPPFSHYSVIGRFSKILHPILYLVKNPYFLRDDEVSVLQKSLNKEDVFTSVSVRSYI